MIMSKRTFCLLGCLLTIGCGRPIATPGPSPGRLPAGDSRQAYLGEWRIEFALDSTRDLTSGSEAWSPAPDASKRVVGRLQVRDSLGGAGYRTLASTLEIDFAALLGREMSCFTPAASGVQVTEHNGQVSFWFTPHAYDCGFSASAPMSEGGLAGTWEEDSFVGPVASGRFWMRRG